MRKKPDYFLLTAALLGALRAWQGYVFSRDTGTLNGDLGQLYDAALRVLSGETPYVDFFGLYGPLNYEWYALWARFAGKTLMAFLSHDFIFAPLVGLLACVWMARIFIPAGAFRWLFLAAIFLPAIDCISTRPLIPLALAGLAFAGAFGPVPSPVPLAAASFLCGGYLLVSPETSSAGLAAIALIAAARAFSANAGPLRWVVSLAAAAIPVAAYAAMEPASFANYVLNVRGLAQVTNYYAGAAFPSFGSGPVIRSIVFYAPYLVTFFALLTISIALATRPRSFFEPARAGLLAITAYSALLLRIPLGRSDSPHLLFAATPTILLVMRFLHGRRHKTTALAGAVLTIAILVVFSFQNGIQDERILPRRRAGYAELAGNGVAVLPRELERIESLRKLAARHSRDGEPVVFLPLPFYAHLAGRRPGIPFLLPEHVVIDPRYPALLVDRMEKLKVPLVVVDRGLVLDAPAECSRPRHVAGLSGYINWESSGDEVIFREFRQYLAAHYRLVPNDRSYAVFVRRASPAPPPPEAMVAEVPVDGLDPAILARGGKAAIVLPAVRFDEMRIRVRCGYLPGLSSFAKTFLRAAFTSPEGRETAAVLPVPPEFLEKDLRFSVRPGAAARLTLGILVDGALAPSPRRVRVEYIRLFRTSCGEGAAGRNGR